MRKFISLFVIMMFTIVVAACSKDATTTTEEATTTTEQTTTTEAPDPDAKVVTFSSWGLGTAEGNNLLRRQIAEFNETNDEIQIQIVEPEGDWTQWLTTKAAAGEFPDIVMVGNVPDYVVNEWIGDISDVIDDEWEDIPVALRDSVTYGDNIYGIPAAQHYFGYYANLDLIEEAGSTDVFDDFTYTPEQFFTVIEDMKDVNVSDGTGTIGIANSTHLVNWYPSVLDTTGEIGHFIWNGENFDLNGQPMKDSIAKAAGLYTNAYSYDSYSADAQGTEENPLPSEREDIFGNNWDGAIFRAGQMGFLWEASWSAGGMENDIDGLFNYDFVGTPGGKVIAVSDYYGISKTATDKAAAYEVAKYLTFGAEGINDAFDIIDAAKTDEDITLAMPGLPINETQTIIDTWFETIPQPGFKLAYEKAAAGDVEVLVEGNKFIPGFQMARFDYDTGIDATISRPNNDAGSTLSIGDFIWDAQQGKVSYSDYMTQQISDAINYEFLKAQIELNNVNN